MAKEKEITVDLFRQALGEYCDDRVLNLTLKMSDEELLDAKLKEDLQMDSLSLIEVTMLLERLTCCVFKDEVFDSYAVKKDGTVRCFLEFCSLATN